ncbi:hypothetical protein DL96DRAFT_1559952 [Flagelloscypha sp. PMI_526]|nr:hypothetical protein DL96DRAFT_1559952 [Flagelloscypha sp. PMI_526]
MFVAEVTTGYTRSSTTDKVEGQYPFFCGCQIPKNDVAKFNGQEAGVVMLVQSHQQGIRFDKLMRTQKESDRFRRQNSPVPAHPQSVKLSVPSWSLGVFWNEIPLNTSSGTSKYIGTPKDEFRNGGGSTVRRLRYDENTDVFYYRHTWVMKSERSICNSHELERHHLLEHNSLHFLLSQDREACKASSSKGVVTAIRKPSQPTLQEPTITPFLVNRLPNRREPFDKDLNGPETCPKGTPSWLYIDFESGYRLKNAAPLQDRGFEVLRFRRSANLNANSCNANSILILANSFCKVGNSSLRLLRMGSDSELRKALCICWAARGTRYEHSALTRGGGTTKEASESIQNQNREPAASASKFHPLAASSARQHGLGRAVNILSLENLTIPPAQQIQIDGKHIFEETRVKWTRLPKTITQLTEARQREKLKSAWDQ